MDSSISELYILKYKSDDSFFKKAYPASLRPQGKEIVRTWLYYTLLRGYLETGKPCFEDVWIHQHIMDENGRKMSKSLGNVLDPQEILKEHGAEALRFWSAIEGNLAKQDLNCSKEKIRNELKTLTKMINVAKFVNLFEKPKTKPKLMEIDKLFMDYMEDFTRRTDKSYAEYDFHKPSLELRAFIWELFASHYLELVKSRAYNESRKFSEEESKAARYTLHCLFDRFLLLAYPVIPQITSFISEERGINLHKAEFPKPEKISSNLSLIPKIIEFNSQIWKTKREQNISLNNSIKGIKIPKELKAFEKDLISCHKLE